MCAGLFSKQLPESERLRRLVVNLEAPLLPSTTFVPVLLHGIDLNDDQRIAVQRCVA